MADDMVSPDDHPRRIPFWYSPPAESPGIVLGVIYALPVMVLTEVRGVSRDGPRVNHSY